jgi:pteridine reductase
MTADHRKVVLITGAARRVGAVIARALHGRGVDLAIHYRSSDDEARALCDELSSLRAGSVELIRADLTDTGAPALVIGQAVERFGRLDGLVNNASSFYPTPLGEVSEAQWDDLFGTNLKAPFFLCQAAAPHLRAARGAVVNIVDIYAERPLKGFPLYSMAKAGLVMLTKSLARELGPEVRVNAVAPGAILWPDEGTRPATQRQIIERTALKRQGSPSDIADAVRFLLLEAPYVTGQVLAVDGGRSLNP